MTHLEPNSFSSCSRGEDIDPMIGVDSKGPSKSFLDEGEVLPTTGVDLMKQSDSPVDAGDPMNVVEEDAIAMELDIRPTDDLDRTVRDDHLCLTTGVDAMGLSDPPQARNERQRNEKPLPLDRSVREAVASEPRRSARNSAAKKRGVFESHTHIAKYPAARGSRLIRRMSFFSRQVFYLLHPAKADWMMLGGVG